jgi:hypothetical protein
MVWEIRSRLESPDKHSLSFVKLMRISAILDHL